MPDVPTGTVAVIPAPVRSATTVQCSPADESISVRGFEIELDDDLLRTAEMAPEERIRDHIERQLQHRAA